MVNGIEKGIVVAKFGGSVLPDAKGIRQVGKIIAADPNRRFIVASAFGKRNPDDTKITDHLIRCVDLVEDGKPFNEVFDQVYTRTIEAGNNLGCNSVSSWLDQLYKGISGEKSRNWSISKGDWISAALLAHFIGGNFVDAEKFTRFNQDGQLSLQTYRLIQQQLTGDSVYVTPGFYGADRKGNIVLFARGGSDITGAIIARAVNARLYENWKDVNGVLSADPNVVNNPTSIPEMTYAEMREMASRGGDVLQRDAILPAVEAGISIHIRSALDPNLLGTMVVPQRLLSGRPVIGIAGKGGFTALHVEKAGMNESVGVGSRLLAIFEKLNIPYEHTPTGLDSISVIAQQNTLRGKEEAVLQEIKRRIQPDNVDIIKGLGLVCIVGNGIEQEATSVNMRVFQTLASAGIETRASSFATHGNNVVVAIPEEKVKAAIAELYRSFIL